jgi:LysR family transcriptional regulator for metE and metH
LRSAGQILEELNRAEEDIRLIASNKESLLRVSTECSTAYHWLPSIVKIFGRKFPGTQIEVVSEAAAHPIQYLIDRKLDLAIIPRTIHDRQIALEPLFQDKLVAIVHPEHPLARKKYLTAGDFANEHLFLYSERERIEDWTFYGTILKPSGVTPRQITYIALTEGIIEMVKAGLGIAVLGGRSGTQTTFDQGPPHHTERFHTSVERGISEKQLSPSANGLVHQNAREQKNACDEVLLTMCSYLSRISFLVSI